MLTLVTAWYNFKAKFNIEVYRKWISNLLLNVKEFKLIIFTNEESKWLIEDNININLKIIILEIEDFYGYQFKDQWIYNHTQNHLLNTKVDWRVNMLWAEKIAFVKRAIENNYFAEECREDEEWFGWCDIGYFRGGPTNMAIHKMKEWPNKNKIAVLDRSKIYYTQVCDHSILNFLARIILQKNEKGLPIQPIPENQTSVAGGFFLITPATINWWNQVFYNRLNEYFKNNYLVKDDQIIILDCIINNLTKFKLIKETVPGMNEWFAFSHYLL